MIYIYHWSHTAYSISVNNSTLNINNVNVSSAGQYVCAVLASVNSNYVSDTLALAFGYLTVTGMLILYQLLFFDIFIFS